MTQSQFTLGGGSGESGGNDSDNSTEEPSAQKPEVLKRGSSSLHGQKPRDEVALRRSHRDLSAHRSSISGNSKACQVRHSLAHTKPEARVIKFKKFYFLNSVKYHIMQNCQKHAYCGLHKKMHHDQV